MIEEVTRGRVPLFVILSREVGSGQELRPETLAECLRGVERVMVESNGYWCCSDCLWCYRATVCNVMKWLFVVLQSNGV
jgi:hypothetical protein